MPRTIEEGFRDFLKKLTPSEAETSAATSHRESIQSCTKNSFGLDRFFRTGSFGNGTSIYGYSDVDYFAVIPLIHFPNSSGYFLQKLKGALDLRFHATIVKVNRPAITINFGSSREETHEIVPAFNTLKSKSNFTIYKIPNFDDGWMEACPDIHNDYVRRIDNKLSSKVKPLIRFIKAWKYYQNVPITSFYLELQITKYAETESSIQYDIDIRNIFKNLYNSNLSMMQDPMGVSGYIAPCSTENKRLDALSKLNTALTRAEKALEFSQREDIKNAFEHWNLIFDKNFTNYYY